jgi:hypothetical protein
MGAVKFVHLARVDTFREIIFLFIRDATVRCVFNEVAKVHAV